MGEIKLQILAEDIKTSEYTDPRDCAISRALRRLNDPSILFHVDMIEIIQEEGSKIVDIHPLDEKVRQMYRHVYERQTGISTRFTTVEPLEPEDFEYIISY